MKQILKLATALSLVAHVSMVSAQADPNTRVVVIPLETSSQSGTILPPDGVTTFETIPDPVNSPNDAVISGITYQAGSQIVIDDTGSADVKTIRFAPRGGGLRDNHQPSIGISHIISLFGTFPSRSAINSPTIAEITMFGGNFAPRNWAFCDGQLMSIAQNAALFSLLGTNFGGDGRTTFGLPDLRGRTAVHIGAGPGLSPIRVGQKFGSPTVDLN